MIRVSRETLVSGQYGSVTQIRERGHAASASVPPTPSTMRRREHLPQRRKVRCSCEHILVLAQSHERSPQWDTTNKRFRSVDRVEHPAPAGFGARNAEFFAEDPVARKVILDPRASRLLGASVRDRHGGAVGLGFNGERSLVVADGDVTRDAGHLFDGPCERLRRLAHASDRTGSPCAASSFLMSRTVVDSSCRIPATSAASAPPASSTSHTSLADPAPPDATTGTSTAAATARVSSRS